ncbi:MAG: Na+/H+ antiporter subunit E [Planctomycetaceae bacterium]
MNVFFWNVFFAIVWSLATEHVDPTNLGVGFVLGYLVLWFSQPAFGRSNYFRKLPQVVSFAAFYLWELLLSNFRVAYDVVTPTNYMRPGVIAVPLDAKTDAEITLLSMLITLTPGTLSLDLSADKSLLFIHGMFVEDPDAFRASIKDRLERRVLEVMR